MTSQKRNARRNSADRLDKKRQDLGEIVSEKDYGIAGVKTNQFHLPFWNQDDFFLELYYEEKQRILFVDWSALICSAALPSFSCLLLSSSSLLLASFSSRLPWSFVALLPPVLALQTLPPETLCIPWSLRRRSWPCCRRRSRCWHRLLNRNMRRVRNSFKKTKNSENLWLTTDQSGIVTDENQTAFELVERFG